MRDKFQAGAETVETDVKRYHSIARAITCERELAGGSWIIAIYLIEDIRKAFAETNFAQPAKMAYRDPCISFADAAIAAIGTLVLELANPREWSFTTLPYIAY
jgi:hypothetical protein